MQTVQSDPKLHTPVYVLARGNSDARGEKVEMRPPGVFLPDGRPEPAVAALSACARFTAA